MRALGVVSGDVHFADRGTHSPLSVEDRSNTARSDVVALLGFHRIHVAGSNRERIGTAPWKKPTRIGQQMGATVALAGTSRHAAGDRHLFTVRVRLAVHQLGWFADLGAATRDPDPGTVFTRHLIPSRHRFSNN